MAHLAYRTRESRVQAHEIMSTPVASVGPQWPVVEIAALLRERRIGGVPVLAEGALVGIVTERDLLHRVELGTSRQGPRPPWWGTGNRRELAPRRYVKSHGRYAQHVMARQVVIATPATTVGVMASLFDQYRIGRVPVLAGNRLVGIVTCADLVGLLATGLVHAPGSDTPATDEAIRNGVMLELDAQPWWDHRLAEVSVREGVVRFSGVVLSETLRLASRVAAENVRGVRRVVDERLLGPEFAVLM